MATLATFWKRPVALPYAGANTRKATPKAAEDPFLLRALPNEDVFFYAKRIDNSRVVRQSDPRAPGECWSAIAMACVLVALLTSVLAPAGMSILAGYKLEALKLEERRLLDERRVLEVEEAALLSPARLEELAKRQQLVNPSPDQVVHLDSQPGSSLASVLNSR
jgi:hypothetical protein